MKIIQTVSKKCIKGVVLGLVERRRTKWTNRSDERPPVMHYTRGIFIKFILRLRDRTKLCERNIIWMNRCVLSFNSKVFVCALVCTWEIENFKSETSRLCTPTDQNKTFVLLGWAGVVGLIGKISVLWPQGPPCSIPALPKLTQLSILPG